MASLTRERIQTEIDSLTKQRTAKFNELHGLEGALQAFQYLLATLDSPDPADLAQPVEPPAAQAATPALEAN